MFTVKKFTFNPFQENTYVLTSGKSAIIVDPGCLDSHEQAQLQGYIATNGLVPEKLVLTHAHIDHILGNAWVHKTYGLKPIMHRKEIPVLESAERTASMYGIPYTPSPSPSSFLEEGDELVVGSVKLEVLFVPGHAPGHIALYCATEHIVVAGDVLFERSIGRTDLPGGDLDTLMKSIRTKLFTLPDNTAVYCGHGNETTIGSEKRSNPFLT